MKPQRQEPGLGLHSLLVAGLNRDEVFSPKVKCHLVPGGTVWVGGPSQSRDTKQHLLSENPPWLWLLALRRRSLTLAVELGFCL